MVTIAQSFDADQFNIYCCYKVRSRDTADLTLIKLLDVTSAPLISANQNIIRATVKRGANTRNSQVCGLWPSGAMEEQD